MQRVVCAAERFYPLDVDITWYQHDPAVAGQRPPPAKMLHELSSHKSNPDKTFSSSAYFFLEALVGESGSLFTCSVSHQSLHEPIRKSFTLHVKGERRVRYHCNSLSYHRIYLAPYRLRWALQRYHLQRLGKSPHFIVKTEWKQVECKNKLALQNHSKGFRAPPEAKTSHWPICSTSPTACWIGRTTIMDIHIIYTDVHNCIFSGKNAVSH